MNILLKNLKKKNIPFKICKGNALNEIMKLKKMMALHLKYLLLFGEMQKNIILKKFHQKKK
jgi:hypothetical protein